MLFLALALYFFIVTVPPPTFPKDVVAAEAALVSYELRGDASSAAGRVAHFGLLYNGCPAGRATEVMFNGTALASYYPPVRANGYYFVTSDGPEAVDPVRWVVGVSQIPGANASSPWILVGASGWWKAWAGLFLQVAYPTPTERGAIVAVDGR
jgi:hypothetical protein